MLACAILYFTGSLLYARLRLSYYISQFSETQAELDAILDQEADEAHPIEALLKKAGAQNIRELEALYDQYRGATADLAARMAVLGEQEERAAENEDRVPKLLARLQETFDKAGEQVKTEAEVPAAVGNAISRYQAYREAKRKLSDCRIQLEKQQAEEKRLEEARLQSREVLEAVERDMRAFMAQQGFDHAACANGQEALRAYHSAQVQRQDRRGRRDMLLEKTEALRIQLRAEEQDLHRCERELERYIQAARVAQSSNGTRWPTRPGSISKSATSAAPCRSSLTPSCTERPSKNYGRGRPGSKISPPARPKPRRLEGRPRSDYSAD